MPKGGHNKRPTKLKIAEGTANVTRLIDDEFEPTLMTYVPEPPAHYIDKVKRSWKRVAQELLDAGILYSIDMDLLENYCDAFNMQQQLLEDINVNGLKMDGKFGEMANPALVQYQNVTKLMLSIGANLGIGPANRTKIGGQKKKEDDQLLKLLKNKPTEIR